MIKTYNIEESIFRNKKYFPMNKSNPGVSMLLVLYWYNIDVLQSGSSAWAIVFVIYPDVFMNTIRIISD